MSPPACVRHPAATVVAGQCAACLIEAALVPGDDGPATVGHFTLQVPLGESDAGSVFLVRGESPWPRLLRMKQWRAQAPPGFIEAFDELKSQLEAWRHPAIVMPVAAWVDAAGSPSVLTEFRQGVPLLDSVKSGRLKAVAAASALQRLRDVIGAAHARGLAHGSIVAGNVLVDRPDDTPHLLDFGLATLLNHGSAEDRGASSDLEGFAGLAAALQALSVDV